MKLLPLIGEEDVRAAVDKANDDYLHWEKIKYLESPRSIRPEELWAIVKSTRTGNYRDLPFQDMKGRFFRYWVPDSGWRELHFIDQNAGGNIDAEPVGFSPESRERHLISSLMEEAIASSQIEGAATTRKVAKEMLRTARPPRTKAERMIRNNYAAIQKIRDFTGKPMTLEMLHELHATLTEGTLDDPKTAGRFRTAADLIEVVDHSDGQILHVPPAAGELPERMARFFAFANDRSATPFIHPVVRAILLHFWLAYEHPYVDGNGRTARAVFYWYMLSRNYWLFEYLSISRIILRSSRQYARAYLYAEQDDRDVTYFIAYHLRAIHAALNELQRHLAKKQREMRRAMRLLRDVPGLNHRQQALLQHALKHPDAVYTIVSHRNSHNIVRATAATDLAGLETRGFLVMRKEGKRLCYYGMEGLGEQFRD